MRLPALRLPGMRLRGWILIGLGAVALGLAARAWFAGQAEPDRESAPADTIAGVRSVTLWFASPDGDSLIAEARELPEQSEMHARAAALVAALAGGPRQGGVRTLPQGTELLHAYMDPAGVLTLDLSRPFRQGFDGGARAEELVLGSLVRTLSANVPEARRIRVVCGGVALASLGGHFPLDRPLDPSDWP